jgi:hypothetical protein
LVFTHGQPPTHLPFGFTHGFTHGVAIRQLCGTMPIPAQTGEGVSKAALKNGQYN